MTRRSWELAIVGAMMLSTRAIEETSLKPDAFLYPDCRKAYSVIRNVYVKSGAVDVLSVKNALGGTDTAETFLLSAMDECADPSQVGWYCRKVEEESHLQRLHEFAQELSKATDFESAFSLAQNVPQYDGGAPLIDVSKVSLPSHEDGVSTGFKCLDHLTHGSGWVCGQTSVVSAYTKGGKTAAMLQSLRHAAKVFASDGSDRIAVYATFADLSPERLLQRMLTEECGERYESSTLAAEALAELRALPIRFYNGRKHGKDVESCCAKIKAQHYRRNVGVFFADYVQKVRTCEKVQSEVQAMTLVSSKFDDLADSLNIPVVIGSQITVDKDGNATTKYARAIEEDAGFVLRIKRTQSECNFEVPLNRHGPSERKQPMFWNERTLTFEEDTQR